MSITTLQSLPSEILQHVLSFCPIEEQVNYEIICKCFAEAMRNRNLFLELGLFKKAISTLKEQHCQLKELTVLSEKSVSWLKWLGKLSHPLLILANLNAIGVIANLLIKPKALADDDLHTSVGLAEMYFSSSMLAVYLPLAFGSITTSITCTWLLTSDLHRQLRKNSLATERAGQLLLLKEQGWIKF